MFTSAVNLNYRGRDRSVQNATANMIIANYLNSGGRPLPVGSSEADIAQDMIRIFGETHPLSQNLAMGAVTAEAMNDPSLRAWIHTEIDNMHDMAGIDGAATAESKDTNNAGSTSTYQENHFPIINTETGHDPDLFILMPTHMKETLTCSICQGIYNSPVVWMCGHSTCEACYQECPVIGSVNVVNVVNGSRSVRRCPMCRHPSGTCAPSRALKSLVEESTIQCPTLCKDAETVIHPSTPCTWTGTLGCNNEVVQKHLKDCPWLTIPCKYDSTHAHMPRVEQEKHLLECAKRDIMCLKCATLVKFDGLENHLSFECASHSLPCVNKCYEHFASLLSTATNPNETSSSSLTVRATYTLYTEVNDVVVDQPETLARCYPSWFQVPKEIPAKDMHNHLLKDCPLTPVPCPKCSQDDCTWVGPRFKLTHHCFFHHSAYVTDQ